MGVILVSGVSSNVSENRRRMSASVQRPRPIASRFAGPTPQGRLHDALMHGGRIAREPGGARAQRCFQHESAGVGVSYHDRTVTRDVPRTHFNAATAAAHGVVGRSNASSRTAYVAAGRSNAFSRTAYVAAARNLAAQRELAPYQPCDGING
jgi:hypothetical protein